MNPLRILFVTSEFAPLAKTGGLADVSAALPRQLHALGHDVRVFLPLYRRVREHTRNFAAVELLRHLTLAMGARTFRYSIVTTRVPGTTLDLHLVDCPQLYDRAGIYTPEADEHLRFLLLTRAALESCQRTQWSPDIAHWNDWQGGLGPLYLKSIYAWDRLFGATRSVFTIHNLGYQGAFGAEVVGDLSLGDAAHLLHQEDLRKGLVGFLKTGLLYADLITTVSPTYAREIQTQAQGMTLDGLLHSRRDALVGILNGVDSEAWNPRTDRLIPARYSAKSLWRKEKNKAALLGELGLSYTKGVPVLAIVARLSAQKGIELLNPSIPDVLRERDVRFVALGNGEDRYERLLAEIQARYPGQACFWRGYNDRLAHWIEAGADLFLMPSLYEPCGLNQMYSLLYGTVPIVRRTGGLADTVTQFDAATGAGTGVVFDHYTAEGLAWAVRRALGLHGDRQAWSRLQRNGMACDFSWATQAQAYVSAYRRVATRVEVRA